MPFRAKWSAEHKQAIEQAVLAHGYSVPQAHEAAITGTLPGIGQRLEPIPIGKSTVALYAQDARRRARHLEEVSADPATVLHDQAVTLAVNFKRLVEKRGKAGTTMTAADLIELAKAGREVHSLIRALDPPKGSGGRQQARKRAETLNEPDAEPDWIDQVATNGAT